jgi:hypothetical protein
VHEDRTRSRWALWTERRRQRSREPHSVLGLLGVGAAAIVGSTVWLANSSAGNRGTLAFGWATAVLGATMIVGTVVGRARWLIVPAAGTAAAALLAAALNFAGVGLNHHSGDRTEYLGPGTSVAKQYRVGVGDLTLYMQDRPTRVLTAAEVGIGSIHVVVPDTARVQVDAAVGIGTIDVFGTTRDGYRRALGIDNGTSGPTITLRLRVGAGTINVERASARGYFGDFPLPPFVPTTVVGP